MTWSYSAEASDERGRRLATSALALSQNGASQWKPRLKATVAPRVASYLRTLIAFAGWLPSSKQLGTSARLARIEHSVGQCIRRNFAHVPSRFWLILGHTISIWGNGWLRHMVAKEACIQANTILAVEKEEVHNILMMHTYIYMQF